MKDNQLELFECHFWFRIHTDENSSGVMKVFAASLTEAVNKVVRSHSMRKYGLKCLDLVANPITGKVPEYYEPLKAVWRKKA